MPKRQLALVTLSIIISLIFMLFRSGVGGFLSAEMINRINAFLKRAKRVGHVECSVTIDDLISNSHYELFIKDVSSRSFIVPFASAYAY